MMQVLVYDDNPEIANSLASKILAVYDNANVKAVKRENFQELIEVINRRRTSWRDGEDHIGSIESTDADQSDVIVVDYDLLRYSEKADTTGSRLAYLLRSFSTCGLIIVLNEYGSNTFDMSLRTSSLDFADLHIGDVQIDNPGLWTVPFEGYRPWHWPVLPNARASFEKCVVDVQENFDEPILEFLGLGRFIDWMPKQARDFFLGSERMETVRFNTFLKNARGGIESKDQLLPEYTARVVAARLVAFLNRLVLPEQSVLVDAPHLVSRFPSLLGDEHQEIADWNRLCDPINEEIDQLLSDVLKEHRFEKRHWLWRPAWYWPNINKDARIAEVKDPWTVKDVDWVFCENMSRYLPTTYVDDFRADVSPPFNKRFVLRRDSPEALKYVNKVGSGGPQDPLGVEYVPQAAFSI